MKTIWSVGIGAVLLAGCGGAKEIPDITEPDGEEGTQVDYSRLVRTPVTDQALALADPATLERHIKNGLRLQLDGFTYAPPYALSPDAGGTSSSGGFGNPGSSSSGSASAGSSSSNSSSGGAAGDDAYSDTNVHVVGVDEADEAKYDGQHWFVRTYPHFTDYFPVESPGIQIAATDPATATLEVLSHFALDGSWEYHDGMYLVRNADTTTHLAVIGRMPTYSYYYPTEPVPGPGPIWTSTSSSSSSSGGPVALAQSEAASSSSSSSSSTSSTSSSSSGFAGIPWYQPTNGKARIQLIDVQDPASPNLAWDIQLDGEIIDTRRIDDTLYLVTRYQPWLAELAPDYNDPSLRKSNEEVLSEADVATLMPHYQVGETRQPLSTDCYLQNNISPDMGLSNLVHVTAIDLKNRRLIASECVNSDVAHISLWPKSLYLTGTIYSDRGEQNTVIHKFAIDETGAHYAATGSVAGVIGFNSDPAFRLHEHEGDLRIVTTDWFDGVRHRLFILSQTADTLEVVASLPNTAQPAPIGKPNEDIYAVRFEDDRAFIVTFLRTDPLYAIDLSDRLAPKIAGELEVPGFATYMHPLNDQYLFTLGRHANEFGTTLGIKAELIDVSEGDPKSIGTLIFGADGADSDALHNLRALSLLKVDDDQWRIALPLTRYDQQLQQTGLQLLEISGLTGANAQLQDAGAITVESGPAYYSGLGFSRGILHADAVFFTHNNAFWAANWAAPDQAVGPLAHKLAECSQEPVNGLEVEVYLAEWDGIQNACDAVLTATDGEFTEQLQARDNGYGDYCWFTGVADRPGEYLLETTYPGFAKSLRRVQIHQNRCHVVPNYSHVYLTPSEQCAENGIPAISVGVDVPSAAPSLDVCSASVEVVHQGERHVLEPRPEVIEAAPVGFCGFSGLDDVSGEMTLEVRLEGFEPYVESGIVVQEENCYVITEGRNITLQPTP